MPVEVFGPIGHSHDFAAEIRLIAQKGVHIPALLPQVGSAIEALLDRARELHEQLPQEPPTFTHGDKKIRTRSEEHTSELQSPCNLVCRLLLEKKTKIS